jgi:deoxyribonuclease-4
MSVAGGLHCAVERAKAVGCDCVQIFTANARRWYRPAASLAVTPTAKRKTTAQSGPFLSKNNNQWRAKPISDDDASRFRAALKKLRVKHPLAHASYLINLASPDEELWKKSIDSFIVELRRAEQLGIPYVVVHPGAYTTSSLEAGVKRVAAALDEVHRQTRGIAAQCLLETTSGQGSCLGCRFEHLAEIIERSHDPERLAVCVDTCHIFSAGYPLGSAADYQATIKKLDSVIGVKLVKAIHVNDSKAKFGSGVDRHAHIGRGEMGLEPFRLLLNDRRFARVPMYLETNKGEENGLDLDEINLEVLRRLVKQQK